MAADAQHLLQAQAGDIASLCYHVFALLQRMTCCANMTPYMRPPINATEVTWTSVCLYVHICVHVSVIHGREGMVFLSYCFIPPR
jgi:hypothetical protein